MSDPLCRHALPQGFTSGKLDRAIITACQSQAQPCLYRPFTPEISQGHSPASHQSLMLSCLLPRHPYPAKPAPNISQAGSSFSQPSLSWCLPYPQNWGQASCQSGPSLNMLSWVHSQLQPCLCQVHSWSFQSQLGPSPTCWAGSISMPSVFQPGPFLAMSNHIWTLPNQAKASLSLAKSLPRQCPVLHRGTSTNC